MSNKALKLCSVGALIRSQLRILCSIVSLYLCSGTLGWTLQGIQGLLLSNPYLPFSFSFIFYITLCNIFNSNSAITLPKARPVLNIHTNCWAFTQENIMPIFLLFIKGPRSRCYGRTAALRLIVQPCDEDEFFFCFSNLMEHRWNKIDRGKPEVLRRKTFPSATLSTTNPTWTDPGLNPGLRGERSATDRLSHGTANIIPKSSTDKRYVPSDLLSAILTLQALGLHCVMLTSSYGTLYSGG
jgi:hypothetical protein